MNILIVSIRAMGDVLRTSFLAQALKDKYHKNSPKIYWITDEKMVDLLSQNSHIDFAISEKRRQQLSKIPFDLIINLEDGASECKFVSSLNYKKIIGCYLNADKKIDYSLESAYWFDMSLSSKKGLKKADELKLKNKKTHRQILADMIGVNYKKYEPYLKLSSQQRKLASAFKRRHNLTSGDLIIGINTGGADTWPKALSVEKTAKLIDSLYTKYKAKILLFGGPQEVERNGQIYKLSKSPIIDTGCGNNLLEFPALVSVCSLFITTDTLGLHIALAIKRKVICLIGPTSPTEIDLYGLGEKILSKSKELSTYRKATKKCMDSIDLKEIMIAAEKILNQTITLLITSFKEPDTIGKAIEAALNQKTSRKYKILISAPDEETLIIAKKYASNNSSVSVFKDPGKGKSYALNILFKEIRTDILILTDGDVSISENSIEEISNLFLDPEVGCVTGRPIPIENKKTKYGYWANLLFEAAHIWRKNAAETNSFLECSGYLFAFKKNKIDEIPLDVAEDTIIPYYLWEKGYKIGYAEKARVFVKNVDNLKDWIKQKKRTSKAHETLMKYVDIKTTPRKKTFLNEVKGIKLVLEYPRNYQEFIWTIELIFARLYMWLSTLWDTKLANSNYSDSWERVESTK